VEEKDVNLSWTTSLNPETIGGNIFLFKKTANDVDWNKISTLAITANSATDGNNLTDDGEIAYYVSMVDFCREEIIRSEVNNTIHLTGQADTLTDVIDFSWNHYHKWSKGVRNYELWRKLDEASGYRFIAEVPGDRNTFSTGIGGDGFRHNYVVHANENDGSGESWSNNIQFEFDHRVYVPNVFTPNGDDHNEYFEITKIGLYKNSELLVMNRWGKPVFRSRDYKNEWNGGDLEPGVYYYMLSLKKTNKIVRGTVSILK
jgi:gliding motility-associated-like protein